MAAVRALSIHDCSINIAASCIKNSRDKNMCSSVPRTEFLVYVAAHIPRSKDATFLIVQANYVIVLALQECSDTIKIYSPN